MLKIELPVDSDNCIETVAKRKYDSYATEYFQNPSKELEGKIDLLYKFLVLAGDFRGLRKESEPYIIQGKSVKFVIYSDEGEAKYQLEVK